MDTLTKRLATFFHMCGQIFKKHSPTSLPIPPDTQSPKKPLLYRLHDEMTKFKLRGFTKLLTSVMSFVYNAPNGARRL